MKNPILVGGIIMFGLFLSQVARKEQWGLFYNKRFESTSCRGVTVGLAKKIPANWRISCEGNNLAVEIKEVAVPEKAPNLRMLMYRQLANHMSFVARSSATDILEKVFFVRFKLMHPEIEINAVTEGQYIVKLGTLENPDHIMAHLKSTVQVKETLK